MRWPKVSPNSGDLCIKVLVHFSAVNSIMLRSRLMVIGIVIE